jgi:hypothetical protein
MIRLTPTIGVHMTAWLISLERKRITHTARSIRRYRAALAISQKRRSEILDASVAISIASVGINPTPL